MKWLQACPTQVEYSRLPCVPLCVFLLLRPFVNSLGQLNQTPFFLLIHEWLRPCNAAAQLSHTNTGFVAFGMMVHLGRITMLAVNCTPWSLDDMFRIF